MDDPRAALVLGHGAGGGVQAPDLVAATETAVAEGIAVVEHLRGSELAGLDLVAGGRSLGARVACRTAEETGAAGVLCLAFPLQPPGRPSPSRLPELDDVTVPVLVVQGERDPYGVPPPGRARDVVTVGGDHGLKSDLDGVAAAVRAWLPRVVGQNSTK